MKIKIKIRTDQDKYIFAKTRIWDESKKNVNKKKDDSYESSLKFGVYLLSHLTGSTIGVKGLNFSVRNGKRWILHVINTF